MNESLSQQAAAWLLDAGCVEVRTDAPFLLPSGWASPVYMDATRLISLPTIRRELMKQGVQRLLDAGALQGLSAVAGGESSGIAFAAWFAEKLDMPLQYVRKRAVGSRQIEGTVEPGGKVLLVDDDATFTRVMARAMSRRGLRVSVAGSAEEGLALAQRQHNGFAPAGAAGEVAAQQQ